MSACAKELMQADAPSAADIAAAQKIAQKAVDLDHEKNAVSLDALAWALFRSGDLRRAGVIEEQAISLAPSTAIKTECEKGLRRFRSGGKAPAGEE
jgi:hypothetical protein